MSTLTVSPDYRALLRKVPPKVIRTEKENEAYTEILYALDRRSKSLSQAEKELADLLTLLIEDFEEKRYQLPRSKPLDVLRFLMEQHGLLQKDLTDIFGTPSIVSEVLSGKRELNKDHIRRLAARFRVSPELFF
jgi:HTH-type transcriptional regulator/antitoxin HigA